MKLVEKSKHDGLRGVPPKNVPEREWKILQVSPPPLALFNFFYLPPMHISIMYILTIYFISLPDPPLTHFNFGADTDEQILIELPLPHPSIYLGGIALILFWVISIWEPFEPTCPRGHDNCIHSSSVCLILGKL